MSDNGSHQKNEVETGGHAHSSADWSSFLDDFDLVSLLDLWCSLDSQWKLTTVLLVWLVLNLVLIRYAWQKYGDRLSDILVKGNS